MAPWLLSMVLKLHSLLGLSQQAVWIDTCGIVDYNHIVEGHGYILSLLLDRARVIPKLFALTSSSKATTEEGMLPWYFRVSIGVGRGWDQRQLHFWSCRTLLDASKYRRGWNRFHKSSWPQDHALRKRLSLIIAVQTWVDSALSPWQLLALIVRMLRELAYVHWVNAQWHWSF